MDAGRGIDRQNRKSAVSAQPAASSKVLEGNSSNSITQASEKKQSKVVSIDEETVNSGNHNYTHFISLPLSDPGLVRNLDNFRNRITKELGFDESVFNKPKSLHLTIRMLELGSEELVNEAIKALQNALSKVKDALESRPILIRLKGLECMRGSKEKAYVIYAPVEEIGGEGRLLRVCKVITMALVDAGLVEKDADYELKLHATLMNAAFKRREKRSDKVEPIDGRGIFELYGSEEWGECAIREAHLSQRGKFDKNGYFHCCASIHF